MDFNMKIVSNPDLQFAKNGPRLDSCEYDTLPLQ